VFRDPRWRDLLAALKKRSVEAVTREDCRMEWLAVLEYSYLPLDNASRPAAAAEFDALIACLPPDRLQPRSEIRLPICRDPDDQKFLELARDAKAHALITKDKALLKLARKTARVGLFGIIRPEDAVAGM